jgi:hypothetical protein
LTGENSGSGAAVNLDSVGGDPLLTDPANPMTGKYSKNANAITITLAIIAASF